jgi:CRISPR-associated protein Cmr2
MEREVRQWVVEQADEAIDELLQRADTTEEQAETIKDVMMAQAEQQLTGFPELQWSAVPWRPFVSWEVRGGAERPRSKVLSAETLEEELRRFIPGPERPGFLGTKAWQLLQQSIELSGRAGEGSEDPEIFEPNPGVLYPAVYELADRLHAAAKVARPFEQVEQVGYRCSLCGEREWLTGDRDDLAVPPGQRQERKTVWSAIEPGAFARKGEHLCAPCTLKRAWPRLFARWMQEDVLSGSKSVGRFVVSTHTMAVAGSLLSWLGRDG